MPLKILSVAGTRPNLMKVAAICDAIKAINGRAGGNEIQHLLVYADGNRSDSFFNDLELPKPDICLEVGSASDSVQTARIMERFETVILTARGAGAGTHELGVSLCASDKKDMVFKRRRKVYCKACAC